jgi:hypothetical protein
MTDDNKRFLNLVDPAKANDTRVVRMTVGGFSTGEECPRNQP